MGHKVLFITFISLVAFSATKAESSQQQDVEAGDPYLQSLAEFAAGTLVSNDIVDPSIDGGAWMLHRILDAQYVPPNPPAQPAVYFFTLELSLECNNDTSHVPACDETNSTYVRLCEVAVADEPWAKRRSLVPGKIACASQESNNELAFVGTTIANSVPLDDPALVALAQEALVQMANKTNGQHSLVRIESAKRVSDSDSVTYYLALNITTQTSGSATSQVSHEVCEVSMEEVPVSTEAGSPDVPTKVEAILRSLRCFSTGDEDEAERLGLQKFPQEDLSAPHVRTAVLAAYGQIDDEFQSNFKLKLLGSKVLRTVVSLDSGTRDSRLQLGLGSSFCIKRPDLEQEEQDEPKTCNLDPDRDTFVCDITVIQWPWVADAFLFSDLSCQPTNVTSIATQLEPLFEAEAEESTEDSGEVQGNGLEDDQGAEGKVEITANTGPCTGCPQEANVQDPRIQKLAKFALNFMEASSNEPTKQAIVEIKKATAQVVAGIKYELTLQIAQTNCKKGEAEEQCVPNLDTSKVCVVEVLEQSWRNKTEVLGVDCMQTSVPPVQDSNEAPVREARLTGSPREEKPLSPNDPDVLSAKPIRPTLGGWKVADPESESIQSYAKIALQQFNSQSNSESVGKLVKIVSAKTQVVAGKNVDLQLEVGFTGCKKGEDSQENCDLDEKQNHEICDVRIFQNLQGSSTVKSLNCKTVMTEELEMSASSRSEDMDQSPFVNEPSEPIVTGGVQEANSESAEIQEYAEFAVPHVQAASNFGYVLKLVEILSSTTQIVAGKSVTIEMVLGQTNCPIGSEEAVNGPCDLDSDKHRQTCTVRIWDRPWLKSREITEITCHAVGIPLVFNREEEVTDIDVGGITEEVPDIVDRPIAGGVREVDVHSPEIQEFARFALPNIEAGTNSGYTLKLVEVVSATSQVVEGKLVTVKMVLGQTSCKIESEEAANGPCDVDTNKPRQTCTVKIWDRPWLNSREITEMSCESVGIPLVKVTEVASRDSREAPPAPGSPVPVDVDAEEIQTLLPVAINGINQQSNDAQVLKVIRVQYAFKKVVAGILYRLILEVGVTSCVKGAEADSCEPRQICDVKVLDPPGTSTREVQEVECHALPGVAHQYGRQGRADAVAAELVVSSPPLLGGINEVAVDDESVKEIAQFATTTIAAQQNQEGGLQLVKIHKARKQVVAGWKYFLTLELGSVNGKDDNQICEVVVLDRPWTQTRDLSNVKCSRTTSGPRVPKSNRLGLPGGINPADPADPKIQEMAEFATTTVAAQQNQAGGLKLITIIEARIQVVSGIKYYLTLELGLARGDKDNQFCEVVVFDQPWTQTREISEMTCVDTPISLANPDNPDVQEITELQTGIVGGTGPDSPGGFEIQETVTPQHGIVGVITPIDTRDYRVREIAKFATTTIAAQQNQDGDLKLVKIKEARRQIVAGWNYYLTLELGSVKGDRGNQVCELVVFDQSWTQTRQISDVKCVITTNGPSTPSSSGLIIPANPADPDVQEIAQFATTTIAAQQNEASGLKLINIKQAGRQLVAGTNYYLTLELGSVSGDKDNQVCQLVVFDQPWSVGSWTRHVSDVKCANTTSGSSNTIPGPVLITRPQIVLQIQEIEPTIAIVGGIEPVDPAGLAIQKIAEFATAAIAAQQNEAGGLKLISIKWAGKGGLVYYLTLELGSVSGDKHNQVCEVSVFDQPWIPTRELSSVKCKNATNGPTNVGSVFVLATRPPIIRPPVIGPVPGGQNPAKLDDPRVQEIAQFATTTIAVQQNEADGLKLIKVKEAQIQIVAGANYYLTLELGSVSGDKANQVCEVVVFDQSWTQTRELSSVKCTIATNGPNVARSVQLGATAPRTGASSRGVPGGISPANPADPDVQEMAQFATTAVAAKQNQAGGLKLVNIKKAGTQVVAGTNYYLTLELASVNGQGANQVCELVVFDQVWTQTREVSDIKCSIARSGARSAKSVQLGAAVPRTDASTRGLAGGINLADPADPKVQEIALFATTAVAAKQNQAGGLKLVNVKKVRKQVVAGTNYYLTLELASVNGQGANQICELVVFDQVWTQTREVSDIKCAIARSGARIVKSARSGAGPSPVSVPQRLVGGLSPADPAYPSVKEIAQFATSTIAAQQNQAGGLKLVNIKKARTQVVAGTNYYLTLELGSVNGQGANQVCEVVVFDQVWTKTRKVSDVKCSVSGSRKKRDVEPIRSSEAAPPNSSLKSIATDDPKVQELSAFAVPVINQRSNAPNPLHLVKTHTAFTRVVSGLKYYLVIEVSTSNCTPSDTNDCKAEHRRGAQYCQVVVWEQAWLNKKEVTDLSCASTKPKARHNPKNKGKKNPARKGSARAGAASSVGVATPDIQEYATFALNEINVQSNDQQHLVLTQIKEATSQVVSGKNIGLTLEVGYSNCTKGSANANCEVDPTRTKQVCRVKIWDRPWLNDRRVTSLKCEEPAMRRHGGKRKPSRVARQVGGYTKGNPRDPEVKTMAHFAVNLLRWNRNVGVKVVEIKSVEKQLVSGMNYKMSLLVGPANCGDSCSVEECDITVYDQPWTGTRKLTSASCAPVRRKREAIEDETGHLYYMEAFRGFLAKFKKVYATMEEFEHRYRIYRVNQEKIQYIQENEQGTAQYGDTEFSDLTEEEFRALYTGFRPDLKGNHIVDQAVIPNITLPDEFDWRKNNVVTPVKNQGMCGSCWAYSVTGNVEGLYAVKHNKLYSLSEQELVDCDKFDQGCNGGLPENAYKAIQELGGLETEEDYPYEGKDDQCRIKPETAAVQVTGFVEISQNETEMAKWLVANGPISIGINANAMQFYNGGVSHPWKFLCNAKSIDHGVLIVGYGVKHYPLFNKTLPYWIVKNSWGNRWGEQGYYRVYRGDGTCGVNTMATSAVVN